MSIDEIINILYEHMEFNNLINNEQVEEIIKQFPECVYYGQVYRCIYIVDKVIENDLWQSWSKSKELAKMVVNNLRGGYNDGSKQVVLSQNAIGIDLIKLLRIIKKMNLSKECYETSCRLLSNYKDEQEVLARTNFTYKIV